MDDLHKVLHDLRRETDALTHSVRSLKDNPVALVCAREVALATTKLQEAKLWLGLALEEAGSELPAQFADKANATPVQPAQNQGQQAQQVQSATPVTPAQPAQPTTEAAAPAQPAGDQTTGQQQ